ncbi:uncharacterized protein LOC126578000 [Anopheles aquasalis]|uniref:uncharacterized protein LOC126578000 n=1 Tax=Anopheles aquasalis TaxID=42839 RepID=UPI00215A73FE|nr:uncharacterized protein LOC126578000 [Anopheles aquasalis]
MDQTFSRTYWCNYVQTRLSSMEHHLEKQHPSNSNDALKNMEYVRFSVVEKRFTASMSSNGNSIVASNAIIGMGKVIKNDPMKVNTSEDGYDSSCSSDTMSMIASDDEVTIISMKASKSPPLQHPDLENDQVPVCLESIHERREHSNDSSSIYPTTPCVATVATIPIFPTMPNVPSSKNKFIKESIRQVEVNEKEPVWRAKKKCGKQQRTTATVQNRSGGIQHAYSRPISVVISDRAMNYESNIYGTSNETVIPSINVQVNSDINGNKFAYKEVNGIPKPWIQNSSPKMTIYYHSMLKTESLVAFYKCMGHACDFTTQNDKKMEQHLLYHDFYKGFKSEVMQWLECCYCAFFGSGPKELVEHLQSVHGNCGYQCNRCFYRSREASALAVHQSLFHSDSEEPSNRIFQCIRRVKNYNPSDQGFIIDNMLETVPMLVCMVCPSRKYYGILSFKDHIESHSFDFMECNLCSKICGKMELMNHMQNIHGIYLFQCVYCQFGTINNRWIEHHVSVHHPEKIFCYHVRNANQTLEPYVRPRKVIPPHKFVVFSSA